MPHRATWGSSSVGQEAERSEESLLVGFQQGCPYKARQGNSLGLACLNILAGLGRRGCPQLSGAWPWGKQGREMLIWCVDCKIKRWFPSTGSESQRTCKHVRLLVWPCNLMDAKQTDTESRKIQVRKICIPGHLAKCFACSVSFYVLSNLQLSAELSPFYT